jgi:hypothetical protein
VAPWFMRRFLHFSAFSGFDRKYFSTASGLLQFWRHEIAIVITIHRQHEISQALGNCRTYRRLRYDCSPNHNRHSFLGHGRLSTVYPHPEQFSLFLSEHTIHQITPTTRAIFSYLEILMAYPLRFAVQRRHQQMERDATSIPVKSFSQPAKIDWPLLTFWLSYLSIVFGVIYTFVCRVGF